MSVSRITDFRPRREATCYEPESNVRQSRQARRLSLQQARLQRDRERGYSLNVKQVVLAFVVEFIIIGLVLVSQFVYAAQFEHPTYHNTIEALLFPIAFAMVEFARVPLAISVRIQDAWTMKLAALVGVICAVVVTTFSLSQIGHLTFNPRLEAAHVKQTLLSKAQNEKRAVEAQIASVRENLDQKISERDAFLDARNNLVRQLNAQPTQNCGTITRPNPDGTVTTAQSCKENPALKTLRAELVSINTQLSEAEAAVKQSRVERTKYDLGGIEDKISKAEAAYHDSIYQSQLHSYAAMLFRKDPRDVTSGEVKTLEWYLIIIPSIAAALSSTLIAMTAVRRVPNEIPPVREVTDRLMFDLINHHYRPYHTREEFARASQAPIRPDELDNSAAGARNSAQRGTLKRVSV